MKGRTMTIDLKMIDETCIDDFKAGYSDLLIKHFAKKFDWTWEFSRHVLRDAVRFFFVCGLRPAGTSENDVDGTEWKPQVMVSSKAVDQVVDEIFLNTPLLVWLENSMSYARMYHVPSYEHGVIDSTIMKARYDFTIALMRAAGFKIDEEIWPPMSYSTCTASNDLEDCQMFAKRR